MVLTEKRAYWCRILPKTTCARACKVAISQPLSCKSAAASGLGSPWDKLCKHTKMRCFISCVAWFVKVTAKIWANCKKLALNDDTVVAEGTIKAYSQKIVGPSPKIDFKGEALEHVEKK